MLPDGVLMMALWPLNAVIGVAPGGTAPPAPGYAPGGGCTEGAAALEDDGLVGAGERVAVGAFPALPESAAGAGAALPSMAWLHAEMPSTATTDSSAAQRCRTLIC